MVVCQTCYDKPRIIPCMICAPKITLLDLWREWWAWMKAYGIPLLPYQEEQIKGIEVPKEKYTPFELAYAITEHYEMPQMKEKPLPDLIPMIDAYKKRTMALWGYPKWGYKGY